MLFLKVFLLIILMSFNFPIICTLTKSKIIEDSSLKELDESYQDKDILSKTEIMDESINNISQVELIRCCMKLVPKIIDDLDNFSTDGNIGIFGGTMENVRGPYFAGAAAIYSRATQIYVFCKSDMGELMTRQTPTFTVIPIPKNKTAEDLVISKLKDINVLLILRGLDMHREFFDLLKVVVNYINENRETLHPIPIIFDLDAIDLLIFNKDVIQHYPYSIYIATNRFEVVKLTKAYLDNKTVDFTDHKGLQELVKSIKPYEPYATLLFEDDFHKIVTTDRILARSSPIFEARTQGQEEILTGLLSIYAYWAELYKMKGVKNKYNISAEALAGYSACGATRICTELAYTVKRNRILTCDLIVSVKKANAYFFQIAGFVLTEEKKNGKYERPERDPYTHRHIFDLPLK